MRSYDQVFGEWQWHALLRQIGAEQIAERALAAATDGWDGDRLVALENPVDELVIVSLSVWDSERDAHEFASVLRRALELRTGARLVETHRGPHGEGWCASLEESEVVVERWGDMVLYLDGMPSEAEGWQDMAWMGRIRSMYPPRPAVLSEGSE